MGHLELVLLDSFVLIGAVVWALWRVGKVMDRR
jgi:hypothetical protein